MPNLIVELNHTFETGQLYSHDKKTSRIIAHNGKKLAGIFSKFTKDLLGIELVLLNEGRQISFVFDISSGKKGCTLNATLLEDLSGIKVTVTGKFVIKLRAGVAPTIRHYGEKMDLRIKALTYNGGYWNGYNADAKGLNYEEGITSLSRRLMPKVDAPIIR